MTFFVTEKGLWDVVVDVAAARNTLLCHALDNRCDRSYIAGIVVQLDCPLVAHLGVIITFAVEVRFQIRDHFGFLSPNYTGNVTCFFVNLNIKICLID